MTCGRPNCTCRGAIAHAEPAVDETPLWMEIVGIAVMLTIFAATFIAIGRL